MFSIKKQINRLYAFAIFGQLSLSGAWVAILAARGFSLAQIGFAETIFHIVSILFEIPSGVQLAILFGLVEVRLSPVAKDFNVWKEIVSCFKQSFLFLKEARKALLLMFTNSFVGALDILLLFFLQAKLPMAGIPNWALGLALLATQAGGIVGARLILLAKKVRYRVIFAISTAMILTGIAIEHTGLYVLMTLGGFMASMADDALQVRTNTRLQNMFPSEQRATLISIESFTFSCIMIVLSPLAGLFFSCW